MLSRHEESVQDAILAAIDKAKDNLADGRTKVLVFEKLEEALLLIHKDEIRRELGY